MSRQGSAIKNAERFNSEMKEVILEVVAQSLNMQKVVGSNPQGIPVGSQ